MEHQQVKGLIARPRMEAGSGAGGGPATLTRVMSEIEGLGTNMTAALDGLAGRAEKLEDKAAEISVRQQDLEQRIAERPRGGGFGGAAPRSAGAELVGSEGFKAMARAGGGRAKVTLPSAALTSATGSGGALVPRDDRTDPVPLPRRRFTIRQLLAVSETTSNLVEYARQKTRTNNAAVVSEGAEKPESVLAYERAEAPVRTIAHWVPVSRQVFDDAPALQATVDGELRYGLDLAEEIELLKGDGTGEHLSGLATEATAFSAPFSISGATELDTILLAIAQLRESEIEPNGIVLNPTDWARLRSLKDSDGRYLGGGPFSDDRPMLWELPVVTSNSMDEDEFLVGDFARAAVVFDRMEVEVLISSEHSDNFVKNMLTVRAEKRLALAVRQPSALVLGDFGNVSG